MWRSRAGSIGRKFRISGGNPGYTFSWSPVNSNTDSLLNIPAGIYIVTVTDTDGCTVSTTEIVSNQGAATIQINTITPVTCNGGNDGWIDITVIGGTAPFGFLWSNWRRGTGGLDSFCCT